MVFVDSILYAALAWYISNVFPGEYGVPKPYNFFLKKSFWVLHHNEDANGTGEIIALIFVEKTALLPNNTLEFDEHEVDSTCFEPVPSDAKVGVSIKVEN